MNSLLHLEKKENSNTYDLKLWQLLRSKKDIFYYTHALRTIYVMMEDGLIKDTASEFLQQQLKIQNLVDDLIERIKQHHDSKDQKLMIRFEQEIEVFDEIHFRVKKRYLKFVTKHFNTQTFKHQAVA